MKKLLILTLVLGLASASSAALQTGWYYSWEWTDDNGGNILVGDTISVEIFAGDSVVASPMLNTVLNVSNAASASNFALATPGDWITTDPSNGISSDGSGGYNVLVSGTLNAGKVAINDLIYGFRFVVAAPAGPVGPGLDIFTIDAVSGNWSTFTAVVGQAGEASYDGFGVIGGLPYVEYVLIPEPMMIVLLGLGAVVLRRKRS